MTTEIIAVNYWAVLVAAIAAFALGALWYGPLFGKHWMAMMGFTKESMQSTMNLTPAKAMTLGFILSLVTAYVAAHFVALVSAENFMGAWSLAFWIWLGFLLPITAGSYLWENKPFKLFVFNVVYQLISLFVVILIIACWPM